MTDCDFEKIATQLWKLLDDIDTADDIAKSNHGAYRDLVRAAAKRRFDLADSDGYQLSWRPSPDNVAVVPPPVVHLVWVNDMIIGAWSTMGGAEANAAVYRISHPHKGGWKGASPRWHQPEGQIARLWIETRQIETSFSFKKE